MNKLEHVDVEGFWGDKSVSIDIFDDVTFLIGPNGSGKTTLIMLISAALRADVFALARAPFRKISLKLRSTNDQTKPVVIVEKLRESSRSFPPMRYTIRQKTTGTAETYELDEFDDDRAFWGHPRYAYEERRRYQRSDLVTRLEDLTRVSWLSVHRGSPLSRYEERNDFDSTVDQKVKDISDEFSKYFSLLAGHSNAETRAFQEIVFLSLLHDHEIDISTIQRINIKEQEGALHDIFTQFGLNAEQFESKMDTHFTSFRSSLSKAIENRKLKPDEFSVIVDSLRIHHLTQEWRRLVAKQEGILKPRANFLETINSMLERKELVIDDRNQPTITTQSGKQFGLHRLSSGEKQIFILLGQALLQEQEPWIYIADEPELSLHVRWQSQLVNNLRKINSNAQIIMATHSPDILSHYSDRSVSMDEYIK